MSAAIEFETPRLRLRQWRNADRAPFAALNADPAVMEFFPAFIAREASDASIDAWQSQLVERGWSNWAAEIRATNEFIGFVGLTVPRRALAFSPCVEIGWRLARAHWRRGFATEAARDVLRVGFARLGLPEIVSFTAAQNRRSRAVMERIGMHDAREDFDHPGIPEGHPLRRHCLYRLRRAQWEAGHAESGATLRQAVRADVRGIRRVRRAVTENRLRSRLISDEEVIDAIERTGRGWVIECENTVIGFAIGNAENGNIWALFIDPGHEARGYGRRLHDEMTGWLFARGLRRLWLTTDAGTRAERFYKRAGWQNCGRSPSGEVIFELMRPESSKGIEP